MIKLITIPRAIFSVITCSAYTIITAILIILVIPFDKDQKKSSFLIYIWSGFILWSVNIKVEVLGKENLPQKGGLFLFTHSSLFDIPIIFHHIGGHVRFGAKHDLFKIPFFGTAMKLIGILPIVRHQREKVLDLYKESIDNVYQGRQYALAPEGTRQEGNQLGTFKSGPFIFAISGQFEMYPVVIVGCENILLKKSFLLPGYNSWENHVVMRVLPPIETKGWVIENRRGLQEKTHESMNKAHAEVRLYCKEHYGN